MSNEEAKQALRESERLLAQATGSCERTCEAPVRRHRAFCTTLTQASAATINLVCSTIENYSDQLAVTPRAAIASIDALIPLLREARGYLERITVETITPEEAGALGEPPEPAPPTQPSHFPIQAR